MRAAGLATRFAGITLAAMTLAACAHRPPPAPADPLARSATWLQGDFDNRAQAAADPRFLPLRLRWTPLWPERDDGRWFLVEQALAGAATPYRRRIQRLQAERDGVRIDVFLLPRGFPDADGADALAALDPETLRPQPGCAVYLHAEADGRLRGGTAGRDCPSRLRGASWTRADVELDGERVRSWDRGFDADGNQVWGSEIGAYEFRRAGNPQERQVRN